MVELINIKLNMLTVLTVECVNYVKLTTLKTDRQRYRATIFPGHTGVFIVSFRCILLIII